MNAENLMLSQKDYIITALPENIAMSKDTAYIIVKSKVDSPDGEITRLELFDRNDKHFTSYTTRDDGICESKSVTLLWLE